MKLVLILIVLAICLTQGLKADDNVKNKETVISENIKLYQLTKDSYIHVTYREFPQWGKVPANGLLYIRNGKALLVDTPWDNEMTVKLSDWVRDSLKAEITHVVGGHSHEDCLGELEALQKRKVKSYCHQITRQICEERKLPLPGITFEDSLNIVFEGVKVSLMYFGGGHTVDNIVVWIPGEKLLFGGCMVKSLSSGNLGNTREADLEAWPGTIEKVIKRFKDAEIVIPGHGRSGGTELLSHTLVLLREKKED